MPVVELNLNRIKKLVSGNTTKKKIIDVLPFLGLDIESQDGDEIRIEYSPNRPDYSTDFGIALGLQGLLGIKKGMQKLFKLDILPTDSFMIQKSKNWSPYRTICCLYLWKLIDENDEVKSIQHLISVCYDEEYALDYKNIENAFSINFVQIVSFFSP